MSCLAPFFLGETSELEDCGYLYENGNCLNGKDTRSGLFIGWMKRRELINYEPVWYGLWIFVENRQNRAMKRGGMEDEYRVYRRR